MIFDAAFVSEIIKGGRDLKALKMQDNRFMMPEVIKYTDYINTGYEAMMQKQKQARKQQK